MVVAQLLMSAASWSGRGLRGTTGAPWQERRQLGNALVRLLLIGAKAVDFGAQFVTQLLEAITDKLNERLAPDAIMFGQHAALKHFVLLQRSGDALVDQATNVGIEPALASPWLGLRELP
jgi:hypothetical protein